VNGLNFGEAEDLDARGEPFGRCVAEPEVEAWAADDGCVGFRHDTRWLTPRDDSGLVDVREIVVHPPEDGSYLLTWSLSWRAAGRECKLGSGEQDGDDSGLSFRCARCMDGGRATNSEGADSAEDAMGRTARWVDYSGRLDGKPGAGPPDWAGVAIMDHPANPRYPTKWFCTERPFGFVAANPTWGAPLTLAPGQEINLRWAVLVHAQAADPPLIESLYTRFVG
jgi:hypothetical protein